MSPDLRVCELEVPHPGSALGAELLRLNLASPRPLPFFTPEYMGAYIAHNEHYARSQVGSFIIAVRRQSDGKLVGALPMKRVWRSELGVPYRAIELLVHTEIDMPTVLAAEAEREGVAAAIAEYLPRLLHTASVIHVPNVPADAPLAEALQRVRRPWAAVSTAPGVPMSCVRLTQTSIEEYFRKLGKSLRSNISRRTRNLSAEGQLEYVSASRPELLHSLFNLYLDVEDRSWKRGTTASLQRHPRRIDMYRALHAGARDVEHVFDLLLLDGLPIGAQLSMVFGRVFYAMETCYAESHADLGVGNLMDLMAAERAIRRGLVEMALHGHFGHYKKRWLAETVETVDLRVLRRGSLMHSRAVAASLLRRLRGQPEREVGQPESQPVSAEVPPMPQFAHQADLTRILACPDIERFDADALAKVLPFSTR